MNLIILLASDWYLAPNVEMQNVPAYLCTCIRVSARFSK